MFRSYDHLQEENILLARITQLTLPVRYRVPHFTYILYSLCFQLEIKDTFVPVFN
jgi:hypothetical protein